MKKKLPPKNAIYLDTEALRMVNYSEDDVILEAKFDDDHTYWYKSVPRRIWQEFLTVIHADLSAAAFLNKKIKPFYDCIEIA